MRTMDMFMKKVKDKSNGRLVIDLLGGPEVIGGFDQPGAISNGVVDLGGIPSTYISSMAPTATAVQLLIGTPEELRKRGWFDAINEYFAKVNLFQLGALDYPNTRYLWSRAPIKSIADIKGLKLRAIGTDLNFARALGASPVSIPVEEIYTAQERGVVDGHLMGILTGTTTVKSHEVSKFIVYHNIYYTGDPSLVMNLNRLNGLPADLQKALKDAAIETEMESASLKQAINDKGLELVKAAKVQMVTFSPEEKDKYLAANFETNWDILVKNDPVFGPKLRAKAGNYKDAK